MRLFSLYFLEEDAHAEAPEAGEAQAKLNVCRREAERALKSHETLLYYLEEDAHAEAPEAGEAEAKDDVEEKKFHPGEESTSDKLTSFTKYKRILIRFTGSNTIWKIFKLIGVHWGATIL